MRILVYGAGVIGCELAHALLGAGNDVTLLARGAWKERLETDGLVIRHALQLRTTRDRPRVIGALAPEDCYDLIFAVMQFSQMPSILPTLAANQSRYIVLVGNNVDGAACVEQLSGGAYPKEVAFGFQGTAGRREDGRVVSLHLGAPGMTIGALHGELSPTLRDLLTRAANGQYRLTWESDMDAWLKCHAAFILPVCFVCYQVEGKLPRASKAQLSQALDAAAEAHAMLKALGTLLRPDGEEEAFTTGRKKLSLMLRIMAKTPVGRLAVSDHAMSAWAEMAALDAAFAQLRQQTDVPMPAWDALRAPALAYFAQKRQQTL